MPEQHFDQAFKVGWLKESALILAIPSRPVTAEPVNLASRSADLLVWDGQRANDAQPVEGIKVPPSSIK